MALLGASADAFFLFCPSVSRCIISGIGSSGRIHIPESACPDSSLRRGVQVQEQKEHWRELCEQVAGEQAPTRFMELVDKLVKLLDAKERRLGDLRELNKASSNGAA
jgi:hypothetical protein